MTTWVQLNGNDIDWQVGTIFSLSENGQSSATWEVKEMSTDGHWFHLTLPNRNNETNSILAHHPSAGIKRSTYHFRSDTIQKLDPMLKIINKIKYLDKRFLDKQAKKVLA